MTKSSSVVILALRLSRLKPSQVLPNQNDGLFFVFSKGGSGRFASGTVSQLLAPGDVLVVPGALGGELSVAEQCGFNHLGLFNTCFKRRFDASPGQWRKSPGP